MYFQLRKKYVLDDCHYGYIKKIGKEICMEDFGLQKNEVKGELKRPQQNKLFGSSITNSPLFSYLHPSSLLLSTICQFSPTLFYRINSPSIVIILNHVKKD
jgi:hypothetical protein